MSNLEQGLVGPDQLLESNEDVVDYGKSQTARQQAGSRALDAISRYEDSDSNIILGWE